MPDAIIASVAGTRPQDHRRHREEIKQCGHQPRFGVGKAHSLYDEGQPEAKTDGRNQDAAAAEAEKQNARVA